MNLQDTGWKGVDWINVAQGRDRWYCSCDCSDEPSGFVKYGEFFER
jgi:hypothetical protein